MRVTFQCAFGIVIYPRKTIVINKKMYAFFLVCFGIVCSCIGASYQHNVFGSKLLLFDKRNSPLAGRCERISHEKRVVPHGFSSHNSDLSPLCPKRVLSGRAEILPGRIDKRAEICYTFQTTKKYKTYFCESHMDLLRQQFVRVSFVFYDNQYASLLR